VSNNGTVTLTFTHRWNFEVGFDGGAVFVNVNGAGFSKVPLIDFSTNGYTTNDYGAAPTVTVINGDLTATNTLSTSGVSAGLLTSGVASAGIPLTLGAPNLIQVRVTAQDGITTNLYTVNVTMLPSQTPPTLNKSAGGEC
jgi:hypothetical protein